MAKSMIEEYKEYEVECPACATKMKLPSGIFAYGMFFNLFKPKSSFQTGYFYCPGCDAHVYFEYLPDEDRVQLSAKPRIQIKPRIASFLKALCEKHSLSQRQLAAKIGCKPMRISSWIKMEEEPRIGGAMKIAKFGRISIDDLINTDKLPQ